MAPFAGKYVFEKEENISEYLKALGLDDEKLKGFVATQKNFEVKVDGDSYTLTSGLGSRTFNLGQEIDEKLADGSVLKSTASLSGNTLTINSSGADGKKGQRVYEASDSGLVLTLTSEGAGSAKLYFKRQ